MMTANLRLVLIVGGTLVFYGVVVAAEGGIAAYCSHPALIALAVVQAVLCVLAYFAGGNISPGVREDRANRWVLGALGAIVALQIWLPAWNDRIGFWTLDGETIRWFGVGLFAAGGVLRLWPVFVLGDRFSGLVAIQPGHRLVTGGIYGRIRHPSYLGLMINALGWGLAFRSGAGVLLAVLTIPPLLARIKAEEALLHSEFGAEYDAFRARTARLIPGVW